MTDLIIREAEIKDVDAMAELDKLCFAVPWSRQSFYSEITQNPRAIYIVCENGETGEIAGYAGLWVILDEGHITNVAVRPTYRRHHIASRMLEMLLSCAESCGVTAETLEVRRSNNAAISLYTGFDFHKEGVRNGYYEDNNEDALIMWRRKSGDRA